MDEHDEEIHTINEALQGYKDLVDDRLGRKWGERDDEKIQVNNTYTFNATLTNGDIIENHFPIINAEDRDPIATLLLTIGAEDLDALFIEGENSLLYEWNFYQYMKERSARLHGHPGWLEEEGSLSVNPFQLRYIIANVKEERPYLPIRIDVFDQDRMTYLNGLFPLPPNGRWIVLSPFKISGVVRHEHSYLIINVENGRQTFTLVDSDQGYVDYIGRNFGYYYSYIILADLNYVTSEPFSMVYQQDKEKWNEKEVLTWSTWSYYRIVKSDEANPEGLHLIYTEENYKKIIDVPGTRIYTNVSNVPPNIVRKKYALVGLGVERSVPPTYLLEKRRELENRLQTIQITGGASMEEPILFRQMISPPPSNMRDYFEVSSEVRERRQRDWMVILNFIMEEWLNKTIDKCTMKLLDSHHISRDHSNIWLQTLTMRMRSLMESEFTLMSHAPWSVIPLSRSFYDFVVRLALESYTRDELELPVMYYGSIRVPDVIFSC